jgi:hypothetical protein
MNKYHVTYEAGLVLDTTVGGYPKWETAEVDGVRYETQATAGAGMVCDVFDDSSNNYPAHTFARVQSVRKVPPAV